MKSEMTQHTAADGSRVQFELIENPNVMESPVSAEDWSEFCYGDDGEFLHPDSLWFRPSVFYFRRSLRASRSWQRVMDIGLVVADEIDRLASWASEKGVTAIPGWTPTLRGLRTALAGSSDYVTALELGLLICVQFERLRHHVAHVGTLIPPTWMVDPDEATEKGWNVAGKEDANHG